MRVTWVPSGGRRGGRVHWFTQSGLRIVRTIRICVGSLGRSYGSSGVSRIAWVHSGAPRLPRVHSRLVVVVLILVRMGSFIR